MSLEYVSKILFLLRKAGLVDSVRGVQGGFQIARDPGLIHLKNIFDAVHPAADTNIGDEFCKQFAGHAEQCVHNGKDCAVRPVWSTLFEYFNDLLARITLKDLVERDANFQARFQMAASDRAVQIERMITS